MFHYLDVAKSFVKPVTDPCNHFLDQFVNKKWVKITSYALTALVIAPLAVHAGRNVLLEKEQIGCLAKNVYFEARGEPTYAQKVVAYITMARSADRKEWGKTPCETVYQKINGVRQYSWTNEPSGKEWQVAQEIAKAVYQEPIKSVPKTVRCARYYKRTDNIGVSDKSKKWFDKSLKPVDQFGHHTAYVQGKCVN